MRLILLQYSILGMPWHTLVHCILTRLAKMCTMLVADNVFLLCVPQGVVVHTHDSAHSTAPSNKCTAMMARARKPGDASTPFQRACFGGDVWASSTGCSGSCAEALSSGENMSHVLSITNVVKP